jgi:Ni/Co efflux regulator RcnB
MSRTLLILTLIAATALPALARPDRPEEREHRKDDRREWKEDRKDDRRERKEDRKEDRSYWKDHDRRERDYWKERDGRDHRAHRYDDEDRGHGRRQLAPPWMNGYWRSGETRRYVALVPGDPSRMYVFLDGRWVLRLVRDPRARLDLEGAYRLPMAPPPIAPPRLGLDLHVVLFN